MNREFYLIVYRPSAVVLRAMRRLGVQPRGLSRGRLLGTAALSFLWLGGCDVAPSHVNFRGMSGCTVRLCKLTWPLVRALMTAEDLCQVRREARRWAMRARPPGWRPTASKRLA